MEHQVAQGSSAFIQYGIAGAVLVVVGMFLWFLTKERDDRRQERDRHEETVRSIVGDFRTYTTQMLDAVKQCTANQHNAK